MVPRASAPPWIAGGWRYWNRLHEYPHTLEVAPIDVVAVHRGPADVQLGDPPTTTPCPALTKVVRSFASCACPTTLWSVTTKAA